MEYFTKESIQPFVKGTAFLGSGGGGDVLYGSYVLCHQIKKGDRIPLLSLSDLEKNDYVLCIGGVGAPLVCLEKLPTSKEITGLIKKVEERYQKSPRALMATEIGGGNGLVPFFVAQQENIPVFDGDLLGRAFPEVQMISTNIFDIPIQEAWMSDAFGNVHTLFPDDYDDFEFQARRLCVSFGSNAMLGFVLTFEEIQKAVIEGSVSRAIEIGRCSTLGSLRQELGATLLADGRIIDCPYQVRDGFLEGCIIVQEPEGRIFNILLKNEFMRISSEGQVLSQCPDIITFMDAATYDVISSGNITIGQNVLIISLPGPDIWYTDRGLQIIGNF